MLHHLSLGARDIERTTGFYDAVLAPLGCVRVWSDRRPGEQDQAVGCGPPGSGDKRCEAVEMLLRVVADTSDDAHVKTYRDAIRFYAQDVERTWT